MYDPITQMTWLQTQKKEKFAELSEFRCKMLVGSNAQFYTRYALFYKDFILFLVCYSTLFWIIPDLKKERKYLFCILV